MASTTPPADAAALAAATAEIARLTAALAEAEATPRVATRHQTLTAEEAAWVMHHARPAEAPCLCGCGGRTKGRFVPGHDAVLKTRLTRTATMAALTDDGRAAIASAQVALRTFGW